MLVAYGSGFDSFVELSEISYRRQRMADVKASSLQAFLKSCSDCAWGKMGFGILDPDFESSDDFGDSRMAKSTLPNTP